MGEWGIKVNIIKKGKYKDILSSWREMEDDERQLLERLVENIYNQFVRDVAEGREKSVEEVRKIADGSIFTGEEALEKGLVDELGDFKRALEVAKEKAGIKGEPTIIEERGYDLRRLFKIFGSPSSKGDVVSRLMERPEDSYLPVQYLYRPPHL